MSRQHPMSRGLPQGGVLSPLLWILHINRLSAQIRATLLRVAPYKKSTWGLTVQTFADDVSAAVAHNEQKATIAISRHLREAIIANFGDLHLDIAIHKCNNFLMEPSNNKMIQSQRKSKRPRNKGLKEQKRKRMSRDLDRIMQTMGEEARVDLPFKWIYSYRLLGVELDCHWAFVEHLRVLKAKAERRLTILRKVSNALWGLETRVLSITTHSLIESVVN